MGVLLLYVKAEEVPGIKIFRCSSSPCFVNAEYLKSELYKKVGVNPQQILIAREEAKKKRYQQKVWNKLVMMNPLCPAFVQRKKCRNVCGNVCKRVNFEVL